MSSSEVLMLLAEDDVTIPINDEDIFTHEPVENVLPLVKVKYASNNVVYAHALDGLARWLMIRRTDPLVRTIFYTDDQVAEIRRRFGYFLFLEQASLKQSPDVHKMLVATKNDLEKLRTAFKAMDDSTLTQCLFCAHRVSFRIFSEVFDIGSERNLFNITTLEMFLSESATDRDDTRNQYENAFFTLQLFRLFSEKLSKLPSKKRISHTIRQAAGHLVFSTKEPCLRPYLTHMLVNHRNLVPKKFVSNLAKHAKHSQDQHLADLLFKCYLINEGLVPLSHPVVQSLINLNAPVEQL